MSASGRPTSRPLVALALLGVLAAALMWWPTAAPSALSANSNDAAPPTPLDLGKDAWHIVGAMGEGLGGFYQPRGVTGFPDGSFVVVDRKARVQHFDPLGRPLALWSMKDHKLGIHKQHWA